MTAFIGRRQFIFILLGGSAAAWPLAARAQQGERVRRIGVLTGYAESDLEAQARLDIFRQSLQQLGWTIGRNLLVDARWSRGDPDRARSLAKELVELQPDVILGETTSSVRALQQTTGAIPIVFTNLSNPLGSGFVASMARPGGNITGFTVDGRQVAGGAQGGRAARFAGCDHVQPHGVNTYHKGLLSGFA